MKKQIPSFLAGMATMALISSLGIGALAASGQMTINVDPINIQVNGETFVPKDANGATVPVFAYSGTTYAPLRALAEVYGLDVGYDAGSNMATVGKKRTVSTNTPSLSSMYTASTYYPYDIQTITSVTSDATVTNVEDLTMATARGYAYTYSYNEKAWNLYKLTLQENGYQIVDEDSSILVHYTVYKDGQKVMGVADNGKISNNRTIRVIVYLP